MFLQTTCLTIYSNKEQFTLTSSSLSSSYSYKIFAGYKLHTDCTVDGYRGKEDRFGTILIYLNDVAIGGQTYFPGNIFYEISNSKF